MNYDEKLIAEIVSQVLSACSNGETSKQGSGLPDVPVGVSNRHIHLNQADLDTLFGPGYKLTPLKDLSQPGQYACKETLTVIGPSMKALEGVRILGPLRKQSQVEISRTD